MVFSTQGVDFNSSLKFSFDLSLPGKKTSRKTPSSLKVKIIHEMSFMQWKTETWLKIYFKNLDMEMLFFSSLKSKQPNNLLCLWFSWISPVPEIYLELFFQVTDTHFLHVIAWTCSLRSNNVY